MLTLLRRFYATDAPVLGHCTRCANIIDQVLTSMARKTAELIDVQSLYVDDQVLSGLDDNGFRRLANQLFRHHLDGAYYSASINPTLYTLQIASVHQNRSFNWNINDDLYKQKYS